MGIFARSRHQHLAIAAAVVGLVTTACSAGISENEVAARDQEITALSEQVASLQEDLVFWEQLTAFAAPVEMPSMSDHRAFMTEDGVVFALHFDNMDIGKAENLNWVAIGLPGVFCATDQERVESQFGDGFTHFHDMTNDTHGGAPGAEGVWFIHTAVRDFEAPWGPVTAGVDHGFMPTPAPDC